jgi:hypothetical protein
MPTPEALVQPHPSLHNFLVVVVLIVFALWAVRISRMCSKLRMLHDAVKSYSVRGARARTRPLVFISRVADACACLLSLARALA